MRLLAWVRAHLRVIGIVAGVVATLYVLFGYLVAPRLIRGALNDAFDAALTRRPALARVMFNPFTTSVTLRGFALTDSGGQLVLGFDEFSVRADPLASLTGTVTMSRVNLFNPRARIEILPDGSLNVARLLRPQPAAPPPKPGSGPTFAIRRLHIREGGLEYLDHTHTPTYRQDLRPITFELTGFSTRRDNRNGYSLTAGTDQAERLSWNGTFSLEPFRSEGSLRLDRIQAATIDRFMTGLLPFHLTRGEIDVSSDYAIDATTTPATFGLSKVALAARGIALADTAEKTDWIAFAEVAVADGATRVERNEIALGEVTARGGRILTYLRPDGHMNYEAWTAPPAVPDTAPAWTTTIGRIRVTGSTVVFEDRRLPEPAQITVDSCAAELTAFSTAPEARFPATVTGTPAGGGRAAARGTLIPAKAGADLDVELEGADLRLLQPYLDVFTRMRIVRGRVDARGKLNFGTLAPRGPLMRFTGTVQSRDFASVDRKHDEALLDWRSLRLRGLVYEVMPSRMVATEVRLDQPFVRAVVAADRTMNFQDVAVTPDSLPAVFRQANPETMAVRIDSVVVANGTMDFSDLTLRPNFAVGIKTLNGAIRGLSSKPGTQADVRLDGRVDAYAPARIAGTIGPVGQPGSHSDIALSFQHIELTTFTPYSGKFMGYPIERGKLSLDLRYVIDGRQMRGENNILVEQLTLGRKTESPDATRLPIKFAIALLKDREGNIDLDIPVSGSLDDPKFSLIRIIFKVLVRLIVKAVTSPFKLFGALFGGGDDEGESVAFVPGSALLTPEEGRRVTAVGKALTDRPDLRLDVEETYDAVLDSAALAEAHYVQRLVRHATARDGPIDSTVRTVEALGAARYPALVERLYRASFGSPPKVESPRTSGLSRAQKDSVARLVEAERLRQMETRILAEITVAQAELQVLGRRRAEAIKAQLVDSSSVAPDRIFIVTRGAGATRGKVEVPEWASEPDSTAGVAGGGSAAVAAAANGGSASTNAAPAVAAPADSVPAHAAPPRRASMVHVKLALDG